MGHEGHEPTTSPESCDALAAELEQRVQRARLKAALSLNRKLVLLYWSIGRDILIRQGTEGWGADAIGRLAADLRRRFPEMAGLSARSLEDMRAFAEAWPDLKFVQQVLVLLPWGHNTRLLDGLATREQREWYACQAVQHGWSRDVLSHQIACGLLAGDGGVPADFSRTPPPAHSQLARQIIEDQQARELLSPGASQAG
jgi:predicted nuclease of restriction endonuclease-like (RecB) superfamily